jgi:hypothetical protein
MKSQLDLHLLIAEDQLEQLGVPASRDLATMRSRTEHEGEEFLTLTLPKLGPLLEEGLASGRLPLSSPIGFNRWKKNSQLPAFLHGLWRLVFSDDGYILDTPSPDAVRALRQIFYLHSKLKELPTPDKVEAALQQYVETDKAIDNSMPEGLRKEFLSVAKDLWGYDLTMMERRLSRETFLRHAKHGPGVVSDKSVTSNGKWTVREWTDRLQRVFPFYEYLTHRPLTREMIDEYCLHLPGQEPPARVITVPKTAKGPRIITAEPVYNQFIQQGLSAEFERWMFQRRSVSYEYQTPNQELAREGSISGEWATLDLSEASDRLSLGIVKLLLRRYPVIHDSVLACRSQRSVLPDGTTVLLRKFASMGSALTFPIETLVFATIAAMGMRRKYPKMTKVAIENNLRVYGDDIIVPTDCTQDVVDCLESFGLRVNRHKSFSEGNFRESCGGDFFMGSRVVPVRARRRLPQHRGNVEELVAMVAFRNLYWEQYGPTKAVASLDAYIRRLIPFPAGPRDTSALVRWDFSFVPDGTKKETQVPYVYAARPLYSYRGDPLDGDSALLKFFWTPFQEDPKHLQRAGRPIASKITIGKVSL